MGLRSQLMPGECKFECIGCAAMSPLKNLKLLFPYRALRLEVLTDAPDLFCAFCIHSIGMTKLPAYDKEVWLKSGKYQLE